MGLQKMHQSKCKENLLVQFLDYHVNVKKKSNSKSVKQDKTTALLLKCMHLLNINERDLSLTLTFIACLSERVQEDSINHFSCLKKQTKSKFIYLFIHSLP